MPAATPSATDAGLMGFTDAAPAAAPAPAMDADPMAFMADAGGSPPAAAPMPAASEPPAPVVAAAPAPAPAAYSDPFSGMPVKDSAPAGGMSIPEMNALREWEDKHERELEEISVKEETEKKKAAAEELAKWHEDRAATNKKRIATNRTDE